MLSGRRKVIEVALATLNVPGRSGRAEGVSGRVSSSTSVLPATKPAPVNVKIPAAGARIGSGGAPGTSTRAATLNGVVLVRLRVASGGASLPARNIYTPGSGAPGSGRSRVKRSAVWIGLLRSGSGGFRYEEGRRG